MSDGFPKLKQFFETREVAQKATQPLKSSVRVGIRFAGEPADYHFSMEAGKPEVKAGEPKDPDFTLTFGSKAVEEIIALPTEDVGEFGIKFFSLVVSKEEERKVGIKLHSGFLTLTRHGYLGVLAIGGPQVLGWLAKQGLKGPTAIAQAISRIRKG